MRIIKLEELRKLVKVKVYKLKDNQYSFTTEIGKQFTFNGDIVSLGKFLMKIKAKDNASSPRSNRKLTYFQIAQEIDRGSDNIIYVWLHNLNKFRSNFYTFDNK